MGKRGGRHLSVLSCMDDQLLGDLLSPSGGIGVWGASRSRHAPTRSIREGVANSQTTLASRSAPGRAGIV